MISHTNNKLGWLSWQPLFEATGTLPLGWTTRTTDANVYRRDGDLVRCKINTWTVGSVTVTAGSGYYRIPLPIPAKVVGGSPAIGIVHGQWRLWNDTVASEIVQLFGHIATLPSDPLYIYFPFAKQGDSSPSRLSATTAGLVYNDRCAFMGEFWYEAA